MAAMMLAPALWAIGPAVYPQTSFLAMTPDNLYAVSEIDNSLMFFDLESGEDPRAFNSDETGTTSYVTGNGNCAGNGVITGYRGAKLGSSAYVYGAGGILNGRWFSLPGGVSSTDTGNANGVTSDGKRICGNASTGALVDYDANDTWVVPCYWDFDGKTFSKLQRLPNPTKDYAGMNPQYITGTAISDDGHTIVGQLVSGLGWIVEVIVYQQDENGTWTAYSPFEELINPKKTEIPPYPGDGPMIPSQETYMTEAQLAAYNAAYTAYREGKTTVAPKYETYMSADSIAKYEAAMVPVREFEQRFMEWARIDSAIIAESTSFVYNQIALSPNGRYLACTGQKTVQLPGEANAQRIYVPFLYDLKEKKTIISEGPEILVSSVSDNGDILGSMNLGDVDCGYYLPAGETTWIPLHEYLISINPDIEQWIEENWHHTVWTEFYDEDGEIDGRYDDMYISGRPIASRDFTHLVSAAYAFWTGAPESYANNYVSYVVPLNPANEDSIKNIQAVSTPESDAVFDLQGRRVLNPDHGIYISNGKKIRL